MPTFELFQSLEYLITGIQRSQQLKMYYNTTGSRQKHLQINDTSYWAFVIICTNRIRKLQFQFLGAQQQFIKKSHIGDLETGFINKFTEGIMTSTSVFQ